MTRDREATLTIAIQPYHCASHRGRKEDAHNACTRYALAVSCGRDTRATFQAMPRRRHPQGHTYAYSSKNKRVLIVVLLEDNSGRTKSLLYGCMNLHPERLIQRLGLFFLSTAQPLVRYFRAAHSSGWGTLRYAGIRPQRTAVRVRRLAGLI